MTLSYLFSLESKQSSVVLQRSTRCFEQSSVILLIGTEHPLTFHLPLSTSYQPSHASHGMTHRVEYKWLRQPLFRQWCIVGGNYMLLNCHSPAILSPQSWRISQSGFLLICFKLACTHWTSLCHPQLISAKPRTKYSLSIQLSGVQCLRQKTKNSWQGLNFPRVIRKLGLSFPGLMWNSYTASSKMTLFELWHK